MTFACILAGAPAKPPMTKVEPEALKCCRHEKLALPVPPRPPASGQAGINPGKQLPAAKNPSPAVTSPEAVPSASHLPGPEKQQVNPASSAGDAAAKPVATPSKAQTEDVEMAGVTRATPKSTPIRSPNYKKPRMLGLSPKSLVFDGVRESPAKEATEACTWHDTCEKIAFKLALNIGGFVWAWRIHAELWCLG